MKELLGSNLALIHFNPTLPIIVAADASKEGIGVVISHKFPDGSIKAIEQALTAAEQNYGQIEKEALDLVYAVKKFHKMIYGRNFLLQTDHHENDIIGNQINLLLVSNEEIGEETLFKTKKSRLA